MKILHQFSGGIDSTWAAFLLREKYEVTLLYYILSPFHEKGVEWAERAAKELNLPLRILDLKDLFEERVIKPFIEFYTRGLTPNPCALCNREIKFGYLVEYAKTHGFSFVSTGHYVRKKGDFIYRGRDGWKDQSYFLSLVKKENLSHILFPLGDYSKEEVRKNFPSFLPMHEKESHDVCFLEGKRVGEFFEERGIKGTGWIIWKGRKIKRHKGIFRYTIGQRRAIGIAHKRPLYVVKIEKENVWVGEREEVYSKGLEFDEPNLFCENPPSSLLIQVRYRAPPVRGKIDWEKRKVEFEEPVWAVTPGQIAAFYDGEKLIAGAVILSSSTPLSDTFQQEQGEVKTKKGV
ncbi:tRNA 2-thiouridine(34) synthase MnmA [bacterium]|nr:MAG: tRNA 2-thiouridine(34) synthase MnmA [bacterium]